MGDVAGVHRIRGDNNDAMPVQHCGRLDDAGRCWPDPLLFESGTQHRYSIWGWVLVSAVVQGAAGHPFARFMDREVFDRLAMTRAVVAERADVAHGAGVAPTTPAWRAAHLQRRLPDELRRRERDAAIR